MPDGDSGPLIYKPARRGKVGVLVMIAGPSGSGKTLSALRVATGLADGGPIYFCDTERGRALYYADDFEFLHLQLEEPFSPLRFEAAAVTAQKAGSAVLIVDSFSHEHTGPGGVLDMQEAELVRLTRGDDSKRDNLKYTSWIRVKTEHKHMLQRFWQLNCHIVLCCHAEKKLDLIKGERGKMVPNPDARIVPVCNPDIVGAMTCAFLLDTKNPGVPTWLKRLNKIENLVDLDRPLDEETGARLAAWARGDKMPDRVAAQAAADAAPAQRNNRPAATRNAAPQTDPQAEQWMQFIREAAGWFGETKNMADHVALIDDPAIRDDIAFVRKQYSRAYVAELKPAVDASYSRAMAAADGKGSTGAGRQQSSDPPVDPKMREWIHKIIGLFRNTNSIAAHFAIVDNPMNRDRIEFIKTDYPSIYIRELRPAIDESLARLSDDGGPSQGAPTDEPPLWGQGGSDEPPGDEPPPDDGPPFESQAGSDPPSDDEPPFGSEKEMA